jgi:hypothetical protein
MVRTFATLVDVVGGRKFRQALTGVPLARGTDGSVETAINGVITCVAHLLVASLCCGCGDRESLLLNASKCLNLLLFNFKES